VVSDLERIELALRRVAQTIEPDPAWHVVAMPLWLVANEIAKMERERRAQAAPVKRP
jgi:hypothetical protein